MVGVRFSFDSPSNLMGLFDVPNVNLLNEIIIQLLFFIGSWAAPQVT